MQEYLQGESLKSSLASGPLPIKRVLKLGTEIAEALGAAHAAGITHRDVKPDNVFVTPDGHAKVLDFGLAKLTEVALPSDLDPSMSPTVVGTMAGQLMGTAGYMAPEQIEGRPAVDHRADLFAFGAVLYEMTGGQRAFAGRSVADTLSRIQHEEPTPLAELDSRLPAELQRIVAKLLRKDPADRYQSAADLVVDLRALGAAVEADSAAPLGVSSAATGEARLPSDREHSSRQATVPQRTGGGIGRLAAVAVFGVVVAALGIWVGTRLPSTDEAAPAGEVQFSFELPDEVAELPRGAGNNITVTPDGQTVMFVGMAADGTRRLYRRHIDAVGAERFGDMLNAQTPALARDNEWLAVGVEQSRFSRVKLTGGEPFVLCDACLDGTWGDDGYFYFTRGGEVWRRGPDGSAEEMVLEPAPSQGVGYLARPAILPGSTAAVIEVGNYERGGIVAMSFDGERVVPIAPDGSNPIYSQTGHVIFPRGNTLFAVPFDPETLEVQGPAEPVLTGVRVENGGAMQAALAENGTLVYMPAADSAGTSLVLVDEVGAVERVYGERRNYSAPRFSPDGERAVMVVNEEGRTDLWVLDLATESMSQITTLETATSPEWSPDGTWIGFGAEKGDGFAIYRVDVSSQMVQELHASDYPLAPAGFLGDGAELLFIERSPRSDIFTLRLDDSAITPVLETAEVEESAALSGDGRLLVYESERAGQRQVFVRDLQSGQEVQVSPRGGMEPMWARDGRTVVFRDSGDWSVSAASIVADPQLRLANHEVLFSSAPYWMGFMVPAYDTAADGKFLMVRHRDPGAPADRVHAIVNFASRLQR